MFLRFVLVLSCLTILQSPADARPLIAAHRGSSADAPENTLAAMRLAWEQNADIGELDVHLSSDGQLMVIHDANTSRTTGVDMKVAKTESAKLRTLDAGSFKSPQFRGEKIPLLEEMLATIPPHRRMFVEIKSGLDTIPPVVQAFQKSGKMSQLVIIGFNLKVVEAAKKALPQIPVFWLCSTKTDPVTSAPIPHSKELVTQAKAAKLDGLDLNYLGVTPAIVAAAHEAGLQLHVWTVDNEADALRMAAMGVDSITTNRPKEILDLVKTEDERRGEGPRRKAPSPEPPLNP